MKDKVQKEIINSTDRLLRRIPQNPDFIKEDGVLASTCFTKKKGENGVSVDLERLTTHAVSIKDKERYFLYYIEASVSEEQGLENVHDPLPDNYAHSLITGNITRSIAKRLAAAASKIQVD
ncbi:MAG: hypothetical protein GX163_05845 [Bacteroidetes bacterium]|jgi:hypothetical protein|nr:hypothetical protein [Bacteroidota bacterium]